MTQQVIGQKYADDVISAVTGKFSKQRYLSQGRFIRLLNTFDENGRPMFQVFNTCKHFIRCIPSLVYSETNVEDVDTSQEDHNYDEFRYIAQKFLLEPRINVQPSDTEWTPPPDDPLNLMSDDDEYTDTFSILMNY